jgi:MscS family membrane protein
LIGRLVGAFVSLFLLVATSAYANEADWAGTWGAHWSGGDVRIELAVHGNEIVGSIPLHGGQIKGHVEGRSLVGEWSEGGWSGQFAFTLTPSGKAFLGRFDNGEWWSGGRIDTLSTMPPTDQSTPRAVVRSFLLAGDRARTAVPDAIGRAAMLIEFSGKTNSLTILHQIALAQTMFNLMDLTTVNLWEIPEAPFEDRVSVRLVQSGTGVALPLQLHRLRGGQWWIVALDPDLIDVYSKDLLARTQGRVPPREADPALPTARDAMRRFVEAFPSWNSGGRERALSTLDLSQLPEATRDYEGALAAQYLVRILERVGPVITQEVPDDPSARNPYVHFNDPAGRVAIARVGDGSNARWLLTADTVQSARDLFVELAPMPIAEGAAIPHPELLYFQLRRVVARHAPVLLHRLRSFNLEYWQLLAGIVVLLGSAILAGIVVLFCGSCCAIGSTPRCCTHRAV